MISIFCILSFVSVSTDTIDFNNCNSIEKKIIDVTKFKDAHFVDLRCNGLTSLKNMPLNSVKFLNLSYNPIKSLEGIDLDNLEYINITATDIRELPKSLCGSRKPLIVESENGVLTYIPDCLFENNLSILNVYLLESTITPQIINCSSLKNLRIIAKNKIIEDQTIEYLSSLEGLSHLGLHNVNSLKGLNKIKDNINSLSISICDTCNVVNILNELSNFSNLKILELNIPRNAQVESEVRLLSQVEVLMIKRIGKNERVPLPIEILELKNLKAIYDFENVKELKLDNDVLIIRRNFNRDAFYKRMGYSLGIYNDPGIIDLKMIKK
jgi:hypothetical protein